MNKLPMPFGNPATYVGHSGIDYPQNRGTPFRASGDGTVTLRRTTTNGGNMIWVEYDAFPTTNGVGYAHMDNWNQCPPVGARVKEGDILGLVGSSGRSTGPHLHSEVAGYATTDGYWKFFDKNRVVGQGSSSGGTTPPTKPKLKEKLDMDEALLCYTENNKLLIVNFTDKTLIDLGNDPKSGVRAYYANNFPWGSVSEPEWTNRFGKFKYI